MKKIISRKYKIIFFMLMISIIIGAFPRKKLYKTVEELDITNCIGWDIDNNINGNVQYSIPINVFLFKDYKQSGTTNHSGSGMNLSETRIDRQSHSNRTFLLGTERVNIISEETAKYGIEFLNNILYSNPLINDNHVTIVCSGKAKDIMEYQSKEFNNPGEYLEGLVENMQNFSFFSDSYNAIDIMVRQKAEGRSFCLPYISIKEGRIQIDGMAIFKEDKMIGKLNMKDTLLLNILKENKVRGALALTGNSNKSITYEAETNKNVKCNKDKETGKYEYTINIKFSGAITSNTLYEKLSTDPKVQKKFKEDMEKDIQTRCNSFIEKMQKEYKKDLLGLGRISAAKYGRNKEKDWDEVVSNSKIKVNVEVKINQLNRNEY
ncbi:MAG: Ger(x)C family spore germination protein [Solirubrobacterales bacterium]